MGNAVPSTLLIFRCSLRRRKFFKPITGYSLLDKKRSDNIKEKLEIFNLKIKFSNIVINDSRTETSFTKSTQHACAHTLWQTISIAGNRNDLANIRQHAVDCL
jgi:hypothetical protein